MRSLTRYTLWALLAAFLLTGCAAGPSLRALNADEAKIDVYADGKVEVFGEPVALRDLSSIVKNSATEASDTVLIRLHGDPDAPEFVELRRYVTDQMIRGGHYKYRFFSTPKASVTTVDPATGRAETFVSDQPVEILSGASMKANIDQMAAEQKAYAEGTYVSEAADQKPVAVGARPEDLKAPTQTVGAKPKAVKAPAAGNVITPAQTTRTQTTTTKATPIKKASGSSQESLKERWRKQQQQRRR